VLLTEARVRAGRPCRASALKSHGGARAEVGDKIGAGCSGFLSSTGRRVESLRSDWRGQIDRSGTDGGQMPRRRAYPRRRPSQIPACAMMKAEVRGLGVDPGHEAVLPRRLWWAVARQDGRSRRSRKRSAAEQNGTAALGFGAAAG
jgi:hypothetical protein